MGVFYDFNKILDYFFNILELVWLVRTISGLKVFLSIVSYSSIDQKYHSTIRLVVVSISIEPVLNFGSLLAYSWFLAISKLVLDL